MFIFAADIRTAGSASILISLCLISAGLWRHWQLGTLPLGRGAQRITSAMSLARFHHWRGSRRSVCRSGTRRGSEAAPRLCSHRGSWEDALRPSLTRKPVALRRCGADGYRCRGRTRAQG
jgi:hypothetical protein